MTKDKLKIPWGAWGLSGNWQPNPRLMMSEGEQMKENIINGFGITKVWIDESGEVKEARAIIAAVKVIGSAVSK